jgi:hypothetical protein
MLGASQPTWINLKANSALCKIMHQLHVWYSQAQTRTRLLTLLFLYKVDSFTRHKEKKCWSLKRQFSRSTILTCRKYDMYTKMDRWQCKARVEAVFLSFRKRGRNTVLSSIYYLSILRLKGAPSQVHEITTLIRKKKRYIWAIEFYEDLMV